MVKDLGRAGAGGLEDLDGQADEAEDDKDVAGDQDPHGLGDKGDVEEHAGHDIGFADENEQVDQDEQIAEHRDLFQDFHDFLLQSEIIIPKRKRGSNRRGRRGRPEAGWTTAGFPLE